MLCGSVDERRAGEYMAEVRTSSQCERPCAGIEETRKAPGDAGGSSSPVNGDDHTGKRLAGKPHEPFERADGGRAKARPPPTLPRAPHAHGHAVGSGEVPLAVPLARNVPTPAIVQDQELALDLDRHDGGLSPVCGS